MSSWLTWQYLRVRFRGDFFGISTLFSRSLSLSLSLSLAPSEPTALKDYRGPAADWLPFPYRPNRGVRRFSVRVAAQHSRPIVILRR